MEKEVLLSIIALAGVLCSAFVSFITSSIVMKNEIRRMHFEAIKFYESKILIQRMKIYPDMYCLISDLAKKLRETKVSKSIMKSTLKKINEWDSRNAVFFSSYSAAICFDFRRDLNEIIKNEDIQNDSVKKKLLNMISRFEYAIKDDLGIWGIKEGKIFEKKSIRTFQDFTNENINHN